MQTLGLRPPMSGGSTDILAVANSPLVWICALGVFAVIFVQTCLYIRAAHTAGPEIGMSRDELNGAYRAGAIASIGPSLAVVLVATSHCWHSSAPPRCWCASA